MSKRSAIIAGGALVAIFGSGVFVVRWGARNGGRTELAEAGLRTPVDKTSYGIGVTMARSFKREGVEVDANALGMGLRDGLSDKKLLMTDEEMRGSASAFQINLREKRAQAAIAAASDAEKEGQAFLAKNGKQEGVVTLPSGLQYKVLKAGTGDKPTEADTVQCRYRGTLVNGTEFDSSERRGQPVSFKLTSVIPGWQEALKLMPVGSKWQLAVPPQLAYADRGLGGKKGMPRVIAPNTTLVFDVELLAINPASAVQPKAATTAVKVAEGK